MNNLKKLGLTALAGSLVATSVSAGSLDVSGTAKVAYSSVGSERVEGNPWDDAQTITFSGGGDLENGMSVSMNYTMDDAAFSASNVMLDMGDSGVLSYGDNSHTAGLSKYSDVMPTAGEQVWDDVDGTDVGVVDLGSDNTLGYEVSLMGLTASASYARTGLGTEDSLVLISDDLIDGLQVGYGIGNNVASATEDEDYSTGWAKYTSGPATVGLQLSAIDKASNDIDRTHAAISFAVNENLSVSYGISTVDYELSSSSDEESSGISASYTMGGMTVGAVMNKTDSVGGTAGTDYSFTEVSVAFAF